MTQKWVNTHHGGSAIVALFPLILKPRCKYEQHLRAETASPLFVTASSVARFENGTKLNKHISTLKKKIRPNCGEIAAMS